MEGLTSWIGSNEANQRVATAGIATTLGEEVGFLGGSGNKDFACDVEDPGLILGWVDLLEKGTHSVLLLENSMGWKRHRNP